MIFDGLVLWESMLVSSAVGPCLKEEEVINRITSSTPHKPVAGTDASQRMKPDMAIDLGYSHHCEYLQYAKIHLSSSMTVNA